MICGVKMELAVQIAAQCLILRMRLERASQSEKCGTFITKQLEFQEEHSYL